MIDNNVKNFIQHNSPLLHVEKVCDSIKNKVVDFELPDLTSRKNVLTQNISVPKSLKFSKNNYGLAKKFEMLRIVFYRLYAKLGQDVSELKLIVEYLRLYDEYFEWINEYLEKKYYKTDPKVNHATKILKFYIEIFIYKYDFLLKDEEELLRDSLTKLMDNTD